MGGGSLPNAPSNNLHNNTAPANSSKIALKFSLPTRSNVAWTTPGYQPAYKQRRSKALTPRKTRAAFVRKPQYISEGVIGGSISISIYQGANLALTQGPFTAGVVYGQTDFYCGYVPAAGAYQCSNYSNVFAPLGGDTFYVAMYDSAGHLLSVTPGFPGTSFVQATQPAYAISASGYPGPISIQTYGVAASVLIDAPTSCIDPSGGPGVAEFLIGDAAGYPISGPLANPVTIGVSGGFGLYNFNQQLLTTPYTIATAYGVTQDFEFAASSSGSTGVVNVSTSAGSVGINLTPSTTRNLYAVDRLALAPSTTGISMTGLVDSGPSTYNCGTLPFANYATGTTITSFSNPVAIGGDDYVPGVAVLDSVSGTPYLTLIDMSRDAFGGLTYNVGLINAQPAVVTQVPGSNPLALAVSPGEGVGSGMIYILNADGSIQAVGDSNLPSLTTTTIVSAGTVTGPSDLIVSWNTGGSGDYVFATSNNSPNIFEISDANADPSLTTIDLADGPGVSGASFSNPVTYAASADNFTGEQYVAFTAFDSGNDDVVTCLYLFCSVEVGNVVFSTSANLGPGRLAVAYPTPAPGLYLLAANGTSVAPLIANTPAQPTSAPLPAFGNPVTQIVNSYDGLWNGISTGGLVQFFYNLGGTVAGSMSATHAAIVSPYFQIL